jgi:fatty-acid peroxygenase
VKRIPSEKSIDSTLGLMRNPYLFLTERASRHGSDIFQLRLFFQKTIALRGAEGTKAFYDPALCGRYKQPEMLLSSLVGRRGLPGLDGKEHSKRKNLFMSLMTPQEVRRISGIFERIFQERLDIWTANPVCILTEMQNILTDTACEWVGVPLQKSEFAKRRDELVSLFDDAGAKSIRHVRARINRYRSQKWISSLVKSQRSDGESPLRQTPFSEVIKYRDSDDKLLSEKVAAVEVLNLLRPIVAISCFITFAIHALLNHSGIDRKRLSGDDEYLDFFVQEVRRFYPFFPAAVGRASKDFEFKGYLIREHTRMVLDLYGINHDPRIWHQPEVFNPMRFKNWDNNLFSFVPQGGGDANQGHRCPGEAITVQLMSSALRFLETLSFRVPAQEMGIQFKRMPGIPKSGIIIDKVSKKQKTYQPEIQL